MVMYERSLAFTVIVTHKYIAVVFPKECYRQFRNILIYYTILFAVHHTNYAKGSHFV